MRMAFEPLGRSGGEAREATSPHGSELRGRCVDQPLRVAGAMLHHEFAHRPAFEAAEVQFDQPRSMVTVLDATLAMISAVCTVRAAGLRRPGRVRHPATSRRCVRLRDAVIVEDCRCPGTGLAGSSRSRHGAGRMNERDGAMNEFTCDLLVNFFTATRKSSGSWRLTSSLLLCVELLFRRRGRGLIDQRFGAGDRRGGLCARRSGELPRRRLQFRVAGRSPGRPAPIRRAR